MFSTSCKAFDIQYWLACLVSFRTIVVGKAKVIHVTLHFGQGAGEAMV